MTTKPSLLLTAMLCMVFAAPVFAQSSAVEQNLQNILQRHPDLAANPSLVNNPTWQKKHPDVTAWFGHHPKARAQTAQSGAWETNGTWHDPDRWFHSNPNWVYQNHPEWIQQNPGWRQAGDWDDQDHAWHDRHWYWEHRREWAEHHHPEWANEEEHHGPPYGHAWGHYKHQDHHGHDHDNG